ncbi:SRPBCC family protein [Paenibacillus sedimenti]|uniref:SRPBCC domain-containing protein n=1 Tax=Paenibacillus sedimenti TaxID=2770274 RepID=A0A926KXG8_9BACL|nr:SRPBCC domain-containing protein [Paenibacillus sedimenti]MBD0383765.1 SRPBCC domain-containing protein [Paenibacillus sedimenti]
MQTSGSNIHTVQAMDNDFKPVVGHRFQFRTQPTEWWDGFIDDEVLIVDAPNRVSFIWASGEEKHTVTWMLQDLGDGKVNLHLEQTGISNDQALGRAKYGWGKWCGELEKVLEQ